jgi:hypothetical protein
MDGAILAGRRATSLGPGDVREIKVDRKVASDDGSFEASLKITIKSARGDATYTAPDERPSRDEARALLARVFGATVR